MEIHKVYTIDRSDSYEGFDTSMSMAFDELQDGILRRVGNGSAFEVRLILEIMKLSARDGDESYFLGHIFKYHCYLLGLDSDDLLEVIVSKGLGKTPILINTTKGVGHLRDEVRERYATGDYTQASLAKDYGVSQQAIHKMVEGIKSAYRSKRPDSFAQDIINERAAGTTIKRIARKFKVDNARVVSILKPLGMNKRIPVKNIYHLGT